jgi:hypothetical protein
LEHTSLALRTRWLWFSHVDDGRVWSGLDLQFTSDKCAFFFTSTTMTVGNGQRALLWEDRWINGRSATEMTPLLHSCIPKRRRKTRTVEDGPRANRWASDIHNIIDIPEIGQYLLLTALTAEPDNLRWKWNGSGTYSAHSACLATLHGSVACNACKLAWKC